jgi:hypothetical protein
VVFHPASNIQSGLRQDEASSLVGLPVPRFGGVRAGKAELRYNMTLIKDSSLSLFSHVAYLFSTFSLNNLE